MLSDREICLFTALAKKQSTTGPILVFGHRPAVPTPIAAEMPCREDSSPSKHVHRTPAPTHPLFAIKLSQNGSGVSPMMPDVVAIRLMTYGWL